MSPAEELKLLSDARDMLERRLPPTEAEWHAVGLLLGMISARIHELRSISAETGQRPI